MNYEKQSEQELLKTLVEQELNLFERYYGPLSIPEEKANTRKRIIGILILILLGITLSLFVPYFSLLSIILVGKYVFSAFRKIKSQSGTAGWIAKEAMENPDRSIRQLIERHYGKPLPEQASEPYMYSHWSQIFADITSGQYHYDPTPVSYSVSPEQVNAADWPFATDFSTHMSSKSGLSLKVSPTEHTPDTERQTYTTTYDPTLDPYVTPAGTTFSRTTGSPQSKPHNSFYSLLPIIVILCMFIPALGNPADIFSAGKKLFRSYNRVYSLEKIRKKPTSYKENKDGYTLVHYQNTDETSITIPDTYNGKPVTEIGTQAFYGNNHAKTISLPDSVIRIGAEAFMYCSVLTDITIPPQVTELRGNTFEGCSLLRSVILPAHLTTIHGECFRGCNSLTSITLPAGITEIRGNTFENCSSLTSIVIPNGVTRIAAHAFYGCSSLSQVTVPPTVTEIGSSAFRQCNSLQQIIVPATASINERAFKESPTTVLYYN